MLHILTEQFRFSPHRTVSYGSAAMLAVQPNCTSLDNSPNLWSNT